MKTQYYIYGVPVTNSRIWKVAREAGMYEEMDKKKYVIADCIHFLIRKGYDIQSQTIKNEDE